MSNCLQCYTPIHPFFSTSSLEGLFEMKQTFQLVEHLGSIAVCHTVEETRQLLASQPDGAYCVLATYSRGGSIVSELGGLF